MIRACAVLLLALSSCAEPIINRYVPESPFVGWTHAERQLSAMGTSLTIEAIGPDAAVLEEAINAAVAELRRVEDVMTSWRDSPLTRMNASAGQGSTAIPRELADLIQRGRVVSEFTSGAFDATFASVGKLWDFKARPPVIPDQATIDAALERVGWQHIALDLDASTITMPEGGAIGLGGIAKGYGVDRAMAVLMEHGVEHAVVNAGGDLKALGTNFGKAWEVAVRHPRRAGDVLAVIPVSNVCMVTSGDYERFFEHEGKRYHHILDPRTGYPATGCMSATVLAPDAAFADALATALCVLGPDLGMPLVEELGSVQALLVDMNGAVLASTGLAQTKH